MSMGMVSAGIGAVGAIAGAVGSKKSSGGTQTVDNSPWEPAQPWLMNNLAEGQRLQDYYKQNPFNLQQQQAYSNLFGDLDQFRGQMAPGLFGKANEMMGSGYQRKAYDRPGLVGYSPGGQGGGLLQQGQQSQQQQVFGMPQGNYGLLNFAPPQAPQQAAPAADSRTVAQLVQDELNRIQKAKDDEAAWMYHSGTG